MDFKAYWDSVKDIPVSEKLEYQIAVLWLHPGRLPLGVVSIGDETMPVIKIPERAVNPFGHEEKHIVPVIAFSKNVFSGKTHITDIILPQSVGDIPAGAFAGCTGLKRITIPKKVTSIQEGSFAGCSQLSDIYYEGTPEEWSRIRIVHQKHETEFGSMIGGSPVQQITAERLVHIPGNEPLFSANIHFRCSLSETVQPEFRILTGKQDITDAFRTM